MRLSANRSCENKLVKNHSHISGFALSLALKQRLETTLKFSIPCFPNFWKYLSFHKNHRFSWSPPNLLIYCFLLIQWIFQFLQILLFLQLHANLHLSHRIQTKHPLEGTYKTQGIYLRVGINWIISVLPNGSEQYGTPCMETGCLCSLLFLLIPPPRPPPKKSQTSRQKSILKEVRRQVDFYNNYCVCQVSVYRIYVVKCSANPYLMPGL